MVFQELSGIAVTSPGDFFWRALGNDLAAAVTSLGPKVEDPVGGFDYIEIMLDDHNGIPLIDQCMKHVEQLANIVEMQSGGWFIEDIQGLAGCPPRQFLGQLNPLRFAAGKGGRGLANLNIAKADAPHCDELVADRGNRVEEVDPFFNSHSKNICY